MFSAKTRTECEIVAQKNLNGKTGGTPALPRLGEARDYELARLHGAREEGEQAKALAIAVNMLQKNMAVADIVDITGLSHDEIKKLVH